MSAKDSEEHKRLMAARHTAGAVGRKIALQEAANLARTFPIPYLPPESAELCAAHVRECIATAILELEGAQ